MTQNAAFKQKSATNKTKWLKLALVATALLVIPRRSSKQSARVDLPKNNQPQENIDSN